MSAAQHAVVEAEAKLKEAKATAAKQEREQWKQKARQLAVDTRASRDAFEDAKTRFREAEAELQALDDKKHRLEIGLGDLEQEFRALQIPLPKEEEEFNQRKQQLLTRIAKIREEAALVQQRKGQAWHDEVKYGGEAARLHHAYANAKTLADGGRLGAIEGGIARVE